MPGIGWTENVALQFQDYIKGYLKVTPSLYRMFVANGLKRNIGEGIDKIDYLSALEIDGGKMSASNSNSYIALTDTPVEVKRKINKYAFSGGQATLEEHKKKGGNIEIIDFSEKKVSSNSKSVS